ncbi:MAG: ATP-binding cassette domain-containing protein [Acidobacteriota bacterium]
MSEAFNSAGETPAIAFSDVSMSFDEQRVLSRISFNLERNQMIIITGNSASGKSVLLRLAIGLLQPDEGEIFIGGQEIDQLAENQLLELRSNLMGIAFQEDTLFTGMKVFDNAAYRLVEHNWQEAEVDRAVFEILHFVGLENDMEKLPEELSIGMRRRLELARALAGWPPIMLFDEPTSGLDPINARMILDLVIRARDIHHISSLLVSKELHQIKYIAEHYAAAEGGQVVIRQGAPVEAPEIKIMVLDHGEMIFFGNLSEFENSTLPAVVRFKDRTAVMHEAGTYEKDPWENIAKWKHL